MNDHKRFRGKSAVITGSTSGIGLGLARAFAEKGANIMLNGLGEPAEIESIRKGLQDDLGVRVSYSPANMRDPDEITGMIRQARLTAQSYPSTAAGPPANRSTRLRSHLP